MAKGKQERLKNVCSLNTDLQYKDISKETVIINSNVTVSAYIEGGMVYVRSLIPANLATPTGWLFQMPEKYAPRLPVYATIAYTTSANDIGKMAGVTINPDGKVGYYQARPLGSHEGFNIQYPLKRT